MKKAVILVLTSIFLIILPVLNACSKEEEPSSSTTPATGSTEPAATATMSGNWWDEFGEPQYGGELNLFKGNWEFSADPASPIGASTAMWFESLFGPDDTVDPDVWAYDTAFIPEEYIKGLLAESWEVTDAQTITVEIREGIHWQNKEPVNGRELTAHDVEYSYDRLLGTGNGFTEPNNFWISALSSIEKVNAVDDYTVEFKLKQPGAAALYQVFIARVYTLAVIVPHEWVEQGDTGNWENAVGTGPWMLTECVDQTSLTFSANPGYWGTDGRYPENQLPYLDTLKYVIISSITTISTHPVSRHLTKIIPDYT